MGYRKLKFIHRSNYKKHAIIALSIIWAASMCIFIYLMLFFDKQDVTKEFFKTAVISANNNVADVTEIPESKLNTVNNAYVFVNINKKHILTKFVSITASESRNQLKSENDPAKATVKKINKIIKSKTTTKSSDFSIKPAPIK
jgi:hypothetical protein